MSSIMASRLGYSSTWAEVFRGLRPCAVARNIILMVSVVAFQRAGTGRRPGGVAPLEDAYGLAARMAVGFVARRMAQARPQEAAYLEMPVSSFAFDGAHALGALDVVQHAADLALA